MSRRGGQPVAGRVAAASSDGGQRPTAGFCSPLRRQREASRSCRIGGASAARRPVDADGVAGPGRVERGSIESRGLPGRVVRSSPLDVGHIVGRGILYRCRRDPGRYRVPFAATVLAPRLCRHVGRPGRGRAGCGRAVVQVVTATGPGFGDFCSQEQKSGDGQHPLPAPQFRPLGVQVPGGVHDRGRGRAGAVSC